MKNTLLIAGFNMIVPQTIPTSGLWSLADRLPNRNIRLRDCMESGPQNFRASTSDLLWADEVIDYSYGKATEKDRTHQLVTSSQWPAGKTLDIVTIAGVNDCWDWQFDFFNLLLWPVESFVRRALFFNIDVFGLISPASHKMLDKRAVEVKAMRSQSLVLPESNFINIDCNDLVAGQDEITKHTSIKDEPLVLDTIVSWLGETI